MGACRAGRAFLRNAARLFPRRAVWAFLLLFHAIVCIGQEPRTLSATAQAMERAGYVNVATAVPDINISLMYARADNFTGRILYKDLREAYLHPRAAKALAKAQQLLKAKRPDLSLKIYDAARPMHIQQQMWNVVKGTAQQNYVSNPRNGGGLHNYGMAVDITLCIAATGDTIPMGTLVDHLGAAAHTDAEADLVRRRVITRQALENRRLLREVMHGAGFTVLRTEWWHFNLITRAEARRTLKPIP